MLSFVLWIRFVFALKEQSYMSNVGAGNRRCEKRKGSAHGCPFIKQKFISAPIYKLAPRRKF